MSSEAAVQEAASGALRRRFEIRDLGIVPAFGALFVALSISTDTFLTSATC